jgi:hypothetical protein
VLTYNKKDKKIDKMEIQNICLNVVGATCSLSTYTENSSRNIDDLVMAEEMRDGILNYLPEYSTFDRCVVQYTQEQHMDRPRILIFVDGESNRLYLDDLERDNVDFYEFLSDFKQRVIDILVND